jgi:hypothetical protein
MAMNRQVDAIGPLMTAVILAILGAFQLIAIRRERAHSAKA